MQEADPDWLRARTANLKRLSHPFRVSCWTRLIAGNPEAAGGDLEVMLALSDADGSQTLLLDWLV
jgi:hypothetical protein